MPTHKIKSILALIRHSFPRRTTGVSHHNARTSRQNAWHLHGAENLPKPASIQPNTIGQHQHPL